MKYYKICSLEDLEKSGLPFIVRNVQTSEAGQMTVFCGVTLGLKIMFFGETFLDENNPENDGFKFIFSTDNFFWLGIEE